MIHRRKVIQGIGATGLALAMPSIVPAQELRKIRMGFGIKSVNPIVRATSSLASARPPSSSRCSLRASSRRS